MPEETIVSGITTTPRFMKLLYDIEEHAKVRDGLIMEMQKEINGEKNHHIDEMLDIPIEKVRILQDALADAGHDINALLEAIYMITGEKPSGS